MNKNVLWVPIVSASGLGGAAWLLFLRADDAAKKVPGRGQGHPFCRRQGMQLHVFCKGHGLLGCVTDV